MRLAFLGKVAGSAAGAAKGAARTAFNVATTATGTRNLTTGSVLDIAASGLGPMGAPVANMVRGGLGAVKNFAGRKKKESDHTPTAVNTQTDDIGDLGAALNTQTQVLQSIDKRVDTLDDTMIEVADVLIDNERQASARANAAEDRAQEALMEQRNLMEKLLGRDRHVSPVVGGANSNDDAGNVSPGFGAGLGAVIGSLVGGLGGKILGGLLKPIGLIGTGIAGLGSMIAGSGLAAKAGAAAGAAAGAIKGGVKKAAGGVLKLAKVAGRGALRLMSLGAAKVAAVGATGIGAVKGALNPEETLGVENTKDMGESVLGDMAIRGKAAFVGAAGGIGDALDFMLGTNLGETARNAAKSLVVDGSEETAQVVAVEKRTLERSQNVVTQSKQAQREKEQIKESRLAAQENALKESMTVMNTNVVNHNNNQLVTQPVRDPDVTHRNITRQDMGAIAPIGW